MLLCNRKEPNDTDTTRRLDADAQVTMEEWITLRENAVVRAARKLAMPGGKHMPWNLPHGLNQSDYGLIDARTIPAQH